MWWLEPTSQSYSIPNFEMAGKRDSPSWWNPGAGWSFVKVERNLAKGPLFGGRWLATVNDATLSLKPKQEREGPPNVKAGASDRDPSHSFFFGERKLKETKELTTSIMNNCFLKSMSASAWADSLLRLPQCLLQGPHLKWEESTWLARRSPWINW